MSIRSIALVLGVLLISGGSADAKSPVQVTPDDNTIIIYPNSAGKARDYVDLSVKEFHLSNADPVQMANTIFPATCPL